MNVSRLLLKLLFVTALPVVAVSSVQAQQIGLPGDYVKWRVSGPSEAVVPGGTATVEIHTTIASGWKMYALDSPRPSRGVEITFDDLPQGLSLREVRQSKPKDAYDPNFKMDVRYFMKQASFEVDLDVLPEAKPGTRRVEGKAVFQICNDVMCLPPSPAALQAAVEVAKAAPAATTAVIVDDASGTRDDGEVASEDAGAVVPETALPRTDPAFSNPQDDRSPDDEAAAPVANPGTVSSIDDLNAMRAGGLWSFLLLAIGAGLAALLTPCVFPMIPLTVSFFTKHAGSRAESVRMASVYGLSIVVTFTALGVLTAVLVGAAGAQTIAANPWINLFIGGIFVLFALSLLGLFELRLPNGLLNYFNRQSDTRSGYLGVLFMGLTLTLVSFSCTAPFVGGLLAATASNEWAYPIIGMVAFSATFSLPFVVFALFPKGLSALPRSGSWMNTVKVTLGFVELAAALKFLSNADLVWGWGIISRTLAIAVIVVVLFLAGMYLIGKLRLKDDPEPQPIGVVQLLFAIAFFGLSLYMLPGLFGAPLNSLDAYLPPRKATDVSLLATLARDGRSGPRDDLGWHTDRQEAFAQARATNRPVFIDFTGYTCTNCRQMEANVFPDEGVARRLERQFVLLRLYTDDAEEGPELQRYQLKLTGTVALPTYAIVHPESQSLLFRHSGIASVDQFVDFLDRGTAAYAGASLAAR